MKTPTSSPLERRVRAILDPDRRRTAHSRLPRTALSAVGLAGVLAVGAAVPVFAGPALAATLRLADEPLPSTAVVLATQNGVSTIVPAANRRESAAEASARAVERFERLTADGSKSGARWFDAGRELLEVDQFSLSEKAFRIAAKLGYREGASTYNAACALARAGQTGPALDTLDAALEAGYDDPGRLGRDDDLESLHDQPRFARLRRKAEAFERLFQAIDSGFDSRNHIRSDEDLDSLHGDPRFRKALELAAAKADDED